MIPVIHGILSWEQFTEDPPRWCEKKSSSIESEIKYGSVIARSVNSDKPVCNLMLWRYRWNQPCNTSYRSQFSLPPFRRKSWPTSIMPFPMYPRMGNVSWVILLPMWSGCTQRRKVSMLRMIRSRLDFRWTSTNYWSWNRNIPTWRCWSRSAAGRGLTTSPGKGLEESRHERWRLSNRPLGRGL